VPPPHPPSRRIARATGPTKPLAEARFGRYWNRHVDEPDRAELVVGLLAAA